jgi:hypothetical protein
VESVRPVIFAQFAIINYLGGINKNDEKDPKRRPVLMMAG